MMESGKVVSSHSSRWGTTSASRKRRMCRRSSSWASVNCIATDSMGLPLDPGPRHGARLRYDCARLVGVWALPARWIGTYRSSLGFGYQEAAQEDAEAQASQDAEEDALAAPRARVAGLPPRHRFAAAS